MPLDAGFDVLPETQIDRDLLLERGEWWLAGDAKPWQPDAGSVLSDKLVFRPRLTPVAGRDIWHPRRSSDRGRTVIRP